MTLSRLTQLFKYGMCLVGVSSLLGCTPTLNWRQVQSSQNHVQVLMPCKPEQATRSVTLRVNSKDVSTQLHMQACEAGKMNFALAELAVPPTASTKELRDAWRLASLASIQADESQVVAGAGPIQGARAAATLVTRVINNTHQAQFVWFITDQTIYQAAVYAKPNDKAFAEAAETYMSGIQWP